MPSDNLGWVVLILGTPIAVGLVGYRYVRNGATWRDALRVTSKFFLALFAIAFAFCFAMLAGISSMLQILLAAFFIASSGSLIVVAISSARAPHPSDRRWDTPFWGLGYEILLVIGLFTVGYALLGVRDSASGQTLYEFRSGLYLSVITIATVGYGDVLPTAAARPLAMFEALGGYALLGVWVATIMRALETPRAERAGAERSKR